MIPKTIRRIGAPGLASTPKFQKARFAYPGINRVVHERARLAILAILRLEVAPIPCAGMARRLKVTRGNFDRHLGVLERAGLVRLSNKSIGQYARKHCAITPRGRECYREHLKVLRQVYADATAPL